MTLLHFYLFVGFFLLLFGLSTGFTLGRWSVPTHICWPGTCDAEWQEIDAAIDYSTHGQEPEELYYDGQFIKRENGRLVFIDANESNWLDITELGSPEYRFMHRDSGKILEMDREG